MPRFSQGVHSLHPSSSPPRRDDSVDDVFLVTITPVNDPPFWVDPLEEVNVDEGDEIEFTLTADDVDIEFEGDELELLMLVDDGTENRGAEFTDRKLLQAFRDGSFARHPGHRRTVPRKNSDPDLQDFSGSLLQHRKARRSLEYLGENRQRKQPACRERKKTEP